MSGGLSAVAVVVTVVTAVTVRVATAAVMPARARRVVRLASSSLNCEFSQPGEGRHELAPWISMTLERATY